MPRPDVLLVADTFHGQCKNKPRFVSASNSVILKENATCKISHPCLDDLEVVKIKSKAQGRFQEVRTRPQDEPLNTLQDNIHCGFVDATAAEQLYRKGKHTGLHHCAPFLLSRIRERPALAYVESRVQLEEFVQLSDFV